MKQQTAMQELRLRLIDRSEQFRRADMLGPFTTLTLVLTEIELELLEKEKEQMVELLKWMNLVAEYNPMALETDADDIVEMFLNKTYNSTYKQD